MRVHKYEFFNLDILNWFAFLCLGFFLLLFCVLLLRDLAWFVTAGVKKLSGLVRRGVLKRPVARPLDLARRKFLLYSTNLGSLGASGALAGYGIFEARRCPGVVEIAIPTVGLPADLEGFRIVQFSDLHIGPTIKRDYVQGVVDRINGLSADLIVFTGDLADGPPDSLRNDAAPLAQLSAPRGCYFATGNHEYYAGVKAWMREIKRLGHTVLINEHRVISHGNGRILLAGVTDYQAGKYLQSHASSPRAALASAPANDIKILLAHQPRSVYAAAEAGFDLQLSGHTHGGQIIPWNLFVRLQQPYIAGLHRHKNTWIYVNRGSGYWGPPLRVGAPSEITVLTLTMSHSS
ncbi:MAG: metallophosphoesterase [Gammaproteobacteria bacterium]|nr:metallophosphoesterase [Gammaproteobacteria bacterium]